MAQARARVSTPRTAPLTLRMNRLEAINNMFDLQFLTERYPIFSPTSQHHLDRPVGLRLELRRTILHSDCGDLLPLRRPHPRRRGPLRPGYGPYGFGRLP